MTINLTAPQIFRAGDEDRIRNLNGGCYFSVLIWNGNWKQKQSRDLIDGDIWIPILEKSPSEELLKQAKKLQTKPCPKCKSNMTYGRFQECVTWLDKHSGYFENVKWRCENCFEEELESKYLQIRECKRDSLKDFRMFRDVAELVAFFKYDAGPWESLDNPYQKYIGWGNKTTCAHVGIMLTRMKETQSIWREHLQTPEARSKFPKWCRDHLTLA